MQSESAARCGLFVAVALREGAGAKTCASEPKKAEKAEKKQEKVVAVKKQETQKEQKKEEAKKEAKKEAEAAAVTEEEQARRFALIRSVGEECVTEADLKNLLAKKESFRLYDGFEPSGRMHIAQGIFKALNVNKCTAAGGTFVFWVADWFALMNDKMGGDLEKIKVVGQYFIEVWKGAGMDLKNVEFRWASDDIINNAEPYWNQMLDISKRFTIARIKKCCQIMGRMENKLSAAQVLYPLMQCTDIFFLRADICQLGVDQRKVNMLAREYCDSIGRKLKPVILSHHMLYGLAEGQAKMSKSNPDSAIFMEDPVSEVERKMRIAYCPKTASGDAPKQTDEESMHLVEDDLKNPCLDYVQHIVMSQPNATFPAGGKEFKTFQEVKDAFLSGELAEEDLKKGLADRINILMQPVRDHFANNQHAKEILELVRQYKREEVQPPKRLKRLTKLVVPQQSVAVMAPCPVSPELSLGTVLGLKGALKKAKSIAGTGKQVIFYLPDLSALALNCFGDDKKLKPQEGIAAYYDVLTAVLQSFDALEGVKVVKQSESTLLDPSDYWVSVINVGRRFQLQDVHEAVGLEEARVGAIVAALMHVGDILALAPAAVVTTAGASGYFSLHNLAVRYIEECNTQEDAIQPPQVIEVPTVSTITSSSSAASVTDLLVSDTFKGQVKKKFKQAFCEPGNVQENPILGLAEQLIFENGNAVEIKCHFGLKSFADADSLCRDFATPVEGQPGEFFVHPGDLKSAVGPLLEQTYSKVEAAVKTVDKSNKWIANYMKRTSKSS